MMQHYYEEQNGTNIDDLNQQLRDYIDGDFNLPLVDTIFQILANMLGVVVKIDDCFLNDKHTFWPVGYSKDNKYKVLYLERTSRDHYNSLVPLQFCSRLKPMYLKDLVKYDEQFVSKDFLCNYVDDGTFAPSEVESEDLPDVFGENMGFE